jgi:hypothetical protein
MNYIIRKGQTVERAFLVPEWLKAMGTKERDNRDVLVACPIPVFPGTALFLCFVYLVLAMGATNTTDNVAMFKRTLQSIQDRSVGEPTAVIVAPLSVLELRERYPVFPFAPGKSFVDDVMNDLHLR